MSQLGNLDTESATDVIEILKKVAKDRLVIIVTHNLEQIEEYATRIIKMHDGRIVENREVKKVEEDITPKESKYSKINIFNKYRLGARNTFNILPKFLLLFFVFLFITIAVFTEYASFKLFEDVGTSKGYAMGFKDISDERILIKKQDNSYFTDEDYKKIRNLTNVKKVVEDDLFIDTRFDMHNNEKQMYLYSTFQSIKEFNDKLDEGRMPEKEGEIIICLNKGHYYITDRLEELMSTNFVIGDINNKELRIVRN